MAYEILIGRDEKDRETLGSKGLLYLGKSYVKMENESSLSNNVYLDVNKSHVILVSGKRGCLTEDTFIFTGNGYKKIKEFDEKKDKVYSFNKKYNKFYLERAKLLNYDIDEDLFEIQLSDGQILMATAEHPFLVKENRGLTWKIASELTTEDKIVSVLKLPNFKAKTRISKSLARLLGFVLADGNISIRKGRFKDGRGHPYNGTKARLRIFNAQEEVLSCAKGDLEKEFKILAKRYQRKDCNCEVVESKHQKVVNRLVNLGVPLGNKSKIIRVPEIIFLSSKDTQAQFLKALFSCDGFVSKEGANLEYYSNSRKFLEDIHLLLSYFGIHGKIRNKKVTCNGKKFLSYALFIWDYESTKVFEERIGFFSSEKMNRLKKRKFWRMSRRKSTEYISNNLFFGPINNITKKKCKTKVYDLMVPKNHSFIANGVISHNSGKSYSLSVIAEEMSLLDEEVKNRLAVIMIDTMGIFWSMKYPNEKQKDELRQWGLKERGFDVQVFVPVGKVASYQEKEIPFDFSFSFKPKELKADDWCKVFNVDFNSSIGILIGRVIGKLSGNYSIEDIVKIIEKDDKSETHARLALQSRFEAMQNLGIFSIDGIELKDLIQPGKTVVLDVSCYEDWNVKSLVVGLLGKKLLSEMVDVRKKEEMNIIREHQSVFEENKSENPMVWLIIDEAHEFLPRVEETPASRALIRLLREGRQPGISMVLATQQPGEIHRDVMTQADIAISHRVTAQFDIEALNMIMQTYLAEDILGYLNDLPSVKGSGIILDDNSERVYSFKVRPKLSWHGGDAPSAVRIKRKLFEL